MSITLGIYDLFSYLIPGMVYLYIINEFLKLIKWQYIDVSLLWQNGSSAPSGTVIVLLLAASYVTGHIFEIIRSILIDQKLYFGAPDRALTKIRRRLAHSNIQVEFNFDEWSIYQEGLRVRNNGKIGDSERYKADALMMRNLSCGGFLYAVVQLLGFILQTQDIYRIGLVVLGIMVALLGYQRAKRFDEWYYRTIYSQALMYGKNVKEFLENPTPAWNISKKQAPAEQKSKEQGKGEK